MGRSALNFSNDLVTLDGVKIYNFLNQETSINYLGSRNVFIVPISDAYDYYTWMANVCKYNTESAFGTSGNVYTTIFCIQPENIELDDLVSAVNNLDTTNVVDYMFLYPRTNNIQLRDNSIRNFDTF